jgi:hypothetical protein
MERFAIALVSLAVAASLIFCASVLASFLGAYGMSHPVIMRAMPYFGTAVLVITAPIIARKLHSRRD